jgi:hypothetical protein
MFEYYILAFIGSKKRFLVNLSESVFLLEEIKRNSDLNKKNFI